MSNLTIDTLKSAAWRRVNIVAIRTVKLDCVDSWKIRPSARNEVTSEAEYARTGAKLAVFVFLSLLEVARMSNTATIFRTQRAP